MVKYFKINTEKPVLKYRCNEKICFNVGAYKNGKEISCSCFKWTIQNADEINTGYGYCSPGNSFQLTVYAKKPGFIKISLVALNENKNCDASFDRFFGSVGVEVEKLTGFADDLNEYETLGHAAVEHAAAFTPTIVKTNQGLESKAKSFEIFKLQISSPLKHSFFCVQKIPKTNAKVPLIVSFGQNTLNRLDGIFKEKAIYFLCDPSTAFTKISLNYQTKQDFYKAVLLSLILVNYAKKTSKWDGENLIVCGVGSGAVHAVLLAAFENEITFLDLRKPCLFNFESNLLQKPLPLNSNMAAFFAAARFINCPVRMESGLGCDPEMAMKLYNSLNCRRALVFLQGDTLNYRAPERIAYHLSFDPANPTLKVKKGIYFGFDGRKYEVLGSVENCEISEPKILYRALDNRLKVLSCTQSFFNEFYLKNGRVVVNFLKCD